MARTIGLTFLSPEGVQAFNVELREVLDKLYGRIVELEKELEAMKAK